MHRREANVHVKGWRSLRARLTAGPATTLLVLAAGVHAQAPPIAEVRTLSQAFDAAWARQPEAAALAARREVARAQQQSAAAWTPEPAAIELSTKTDGLNRNLRAIEYEVGIAIPLWLPGERARTLALAQADGRAVESRIVSAQLRVAATVREAWWNAQRTHAEADAAQGQLDNARRIAADVARRVMAGDLARADQHQADGAVAAADAAVAQADAARIVARQHLRTLTASSGLELQAAHADISAEPDPGPAVADSDMHGELLAMTDRASIAEGSAALAVTQSRANPELTIATTRDRGAAAEAWQQTFRVGVRIPFGAGPRHDARMAAARADAIELHAQLNLERARLAGERDSARARTVAAREQLAASDRRAQLARESRGFFDKSFRLGETDLPTRLRIEAEAAEAERQAVRARIELAAAISTWRQALGLLPQ
jgi:outer membrane protein, heavy metal efflux system